MAKKDTIYFSRKKLIKAYVFHLLEVQEKKYLQEGHLEDLEGRINKGLHINKKEWDSLDSDILRLLYLDCKIYKRDFDKYLQRIASGEIALEIGTDIYISGLANLNGEQENQENQEDHWEQGPEGNDNDNR